MLYDPAGVIAPFESPMIVPQVPPLEPRCVMPVLAVSGRCIPPNATVQQLSATVVRVSVIDVVLELFVVAVLSGRPV